MHFNPRYSKIYHWNSINLHRHFSDSRGSRSFIPRIHAQTLRPSTRRFTSKHSSHTSNAKFIPSQLVRPGSFTPAISFFYFYPARSFLRLTPVHVETQYGSPVSPDQDRPGPRVREFARVYSTIGAPRIRSIIRCEREQKSDLTRIFSHLALQERICNSKWDVHVSQAAIVSIPHTRSSAASAGSSWAR